MSSDRFVCSSLKTLFGRTPHPIVAKYYCFVVDRSSLYGAEDGSDS